MAKKILIVEDDQDIVDLLKYNLEKEGFKCYSVSNGAKAVGIAMNKEPDLIILDIMMPELDGIETCRVIKSKPKLHDTFVIFLTARAEEYSEIAGFEAGADDYITKPVKPRVLISRIKAILSRKKDQHSISKIQHGDLVIDRDTFKVSIQNKHFTLPKKEFELLFLLASKPDKVFRRESILSKVWGTDVSVIDRTIDVHIRKIREKVGDEKIKTIKGVGYKFVL